jgi:imidazole glycerol-phosphate synthase subunit HisH
VIAIVDYKAGNLASVKKALDFCEAESRVTDDPAVVASASKIVLPGVGHFSATEALAASGLRAAIEQAIARGVPFLGICVGMQWMFEGSTEAPAVRGLGLFRGQCERFEPGMKVPHVGWNRLKMERDSRLLRGVAPDAFVYYTHSYRAPAEQAAATSDYGGLFAAVIERDNLFGVQFHPEKSADAGLRMLRNFCEVPC